jgi:hypothetical protein
MVFALTGKNASIMFQTHGKKEKRTAGIYSALNKKYSLYFLDKILHELVPLMSDLKTPKVKKGGLRTNNFTIRFRQKLKAFKDFEDLLDPVFYDTHKGVYLPLTIHFIFSDKNFGLNNQNYLRMLKLPLYMYKKDKPPAFDDSVNF